MRAQLSSSRKLATIIAITALMFSAAVTVAISADYPERPVRMVVGFPPGGGLDTAARMITPKLNERLGQPWVVDNRSGAAGNIATEIVVNAPPDGHTVLMVQGTSLTVNPTLYKLPFSVEKDLRPVIRLTTTNYILVVHPSVSASTLKELIDFAKVRPGALSYASAGIGSPLNLSAELLKTRAGVNIVHVPYKGDGPATVALLGNEVQMSIGSLSSLLPHVNSGRLKPIAVTSSSRAAIAPAIPTIAESGLPGFDIT